MLTAKNVVARAMLILGRHTVYWAGSGGFEPHADSPAQHLAIGEMWRTLTLQQQAEFLPLAQSACLDVNNKQLIVPACDCSGFVCWALGLSRQSSAQQWINTDSIWADATGRGIQFRKIEQASVGCIVVYPQVGSGEKYGHIALVTEVGVTGLATRLIHCSASNFASAPHDAIKLTPTDSFDRQPKSVYAWFVDMQP